MKSLRSLLSVAVILAFVSPVVTDVDTKASSINNSPPSINLASPRIHNGSDVANTMWTEVQLVPITTLANSGQAIDNLYNAVSDVASATKEVARFAGWTALDNASNYNTLPTAIDDEYEHTRYTTAALMRAPIRVSRSAPQLIRRAWRPFAGLVLTSTKQ